jgi:GNAT superfamily N-acetyltransferase
VTLTLRPAAPDEYAFTHDLTRANMEPYVARFWGGWDPDVYRANYARTENLVARVGGERVGFVRLSPDGDRLVLDDVQVVPAFQNRGIGTRVLAAVERLAAGRGFRAVRLRCFPVNPAYRLYLRAGFAVVERGDVADWLEKPVGGPPNSSCRACS